MLRRKPTRIELKQEDIAEFELIREEQRAETLARQQQQQQQQQEDDDEDAGAKASAPRTGRKTLRSGLSTEQRIRGGAAAGQRQ